MAKIKIGKDIKITGTPNEIKNVVANMGLDKKQIFDDGKKSRMHWGWVLGANLVFFGITVPMYMELLGPTYFNLFRFLSLFSFGWALMTIYLRYKKIPAFIGFLFGISILYVAWHELTVSQAAKKLEQNLGNIHDGTKLDTSKTGPKPDTSTKK